MIKGKRRLRRDFLNASLITTAAAALVACETVQQLIKKTVTAAARRVDATTPPSQPAPAIPEATALVATEQATAEPTFEPTPTWLVGKAPENDSDFIFGAGGSQDQIKQEIIKNGGEEKLNAQINFYKAVLTEQEKQIQTRIALGEKGLEQINVNAFQFDLAFAAWSDAQNQPHFS